MSDDTPEPARPETIRVTIEIPAGLLAGYDEDVERGTHPSREAALLDGLIESHRHHKGRYSTLRIDLRGPNNRRPDTPRDEGSAADAIAAADALTDPETEQPEAGKDDDRQTCRERLRSRRASDRHSVGRVRGAGRPSHALSSSRAGREDPADCGCPAPPSIAANPAAERRR
jgi:hypothetical protein